MNDAQAKVLLDDIRQGQKRVRSAQDAWDQARAAAQACRKEYDLCVAELGRLIEDADSGQMRLPLDSDAEDEPDDSWREISLMTLGIAEKHLRAIMKHGIGNLGEWSDWWYDEAREGLKGLSREGEIAIVLARMRTGGER